MVSYLPHFIFLTVLVGGMMFAMSDKNTIFKHEKKIEDICPLPLFSIMNYDVNALESLPNTNPILISRMKEIRSIVEEIQRLEQLMHNHIVLITEITKNDSFKRHLKDTNEVVTIINTLNSKIQELKTAPIVSKDRTDRTKDKLIVEINTSIDYKVAKELYLNYIERLKNTTRFIDIQDDIAALRAKYTSEITRIQNIIDIIKKNDSVSSFIDCVNRYLQILTDIVSSNVKKINAHLVDFGKLYASTVYNTFFKTYTLNPDILQLSDMYQQLQTEINSTKITLSIDTTKHSDSLINGIGLALFILAIFGKVVVYLTFKPAGNNVNERNYNPQYKFLFGTLFLLYVIVYILYKLDTISAEMLYEYMMDIIYLLVIIVIIIWMFIF